jgi:hypothetical protein
MRRRGVGRAGRPGLVGTVARTAVIAGTATAVSKGVSGKMNAKEQAAADAEAAAQADPQQETAQQQPATDAASGSGDSVDVVAELQKLASLKEAGVLTDDEFAAAKAKLLA